MSSGPVGLDAREYGYDAFSFVVVAAGTNIGTKGAWLVTRIRFWNLADPAIFQIIAPSGFQQANIGVAANGCLELEPNGAHRGDVKLLGGVGGTILIEYWYQAGQTGIGPTPEVT